MFYDTHCHPYLAKTLSESRILETFFDWWGKYLNSIGCDLESSQKSVDVAKKYPWVFASIGIHPTHVLDYIQEDITDIMQILETLYKNNSENIVAIGETWLDYYWLDELTSRYKISSDKIKNLQKKYFIAQIGLAGKLWLPLIIHNRDSSEDILQILIKQKCTNFVFHCFSEDMSYAQKLIEFAPECKLWLWWVVTFKNAEKTQEVAKNIDLKHIIIETDSPYLTPVPFRWKRENEPVLVKEVLSKIIDLRAEPSEIVTKQILQNSTDFFQISTEI